jgi:anti-sigma regulatory factor (Ser/Thr protein kinase)
MPAMPRLALNLLTSWITAAALQRPDDLASAIVERTGCSRRAALNALRRLVEMQWLQRGGSRSRPVYSPGALRQVVKRYPLEALSEDLPWARDFAPNFALQPGVQRMLQHAFQELLNNAIDHSGGSAVTLSVRQTPTQVQLLVSDDGCGLFDRVRSAFAIDDPMHAMLELSKGKLTSQPERHTGRGLFFTSQLADVFDLHANGAAFQRRGWEGAGWRSGRPLARAGTSVYWAVALDSVRTLAQVLDLWSCDGDGIVFDRTNVSLRLLAAQGVALDSRAQARRVAARLQQFRRAELDFEGIAEIGHGFADELFRVFAGSQPATQIVPMNMAPRVAALVQAMQVSPRQAA